MPVRWDASRDHQHMAEKNARAPGRLVLDNQKSTQKHHFCDTSNEIFTFLFEQPFSTPPCPPSWPPPHEEPENGHFLVRTLYANRSVWDPRFFSRNRSTRKGGLRARLLDTQMVPRRHLEGFNFESLTSGMSVH